MVSRHPWSLGRLDERDLQPHSPSSPSPSPLHLCLGTGITERQHHGHQCSPPLWRVPCGLVVNRLVIDGLVIERLFIDRLVIGITVIDGLVVGITIIDRLIVGIMVIDRLVIGIMVIGLDQDLNPTYRHSLLSPGPTIARLFPSKQLSSSSTLPGPTTPRPWSSRPSLIIITNMNKVIKG